VLSFPRTASLAIMSSFFLPVMRGISVMFLYPYHRCIDFRLRSFVCMMYDPQFIADSGFYWQNKMLSDHPERWATHLQIKFLIWCLVSIVVPMTIDFLG
jgi:hypothetical protein